MNAITNNKIQLKSNISVLVAEDIINASSELKQSLLALGYCICAQITSNTKLSKQCSQYEPDILIINTDSPSTETLKEITFIDQLSPLPVIVFAKKDNSALIQRSIKAGVSSYIVDTIQPHRLNSLITVACERFKERQSLRTKLDQAKTQLANRKTIERAKGCIMEQKQVNEEEAFKMLRKMAMNNGQPLATVAGNVISVFNLLKEGTR